MINWHDNLREIGETARDHFGYEIRHTPTITKPNYGSVPDPDRPANVLCAMYEEDHEIAGGRAKDGLRETYITTSEPCVIARLSDFTHRPTQGDVIEVLCLARAFKITDIRRDMEGMTRLLLEDQNQIIGA